MSDYALKTKQYNHPMQPIGIAQDGVIRFKENAIVRYLIDHCTRNGTCDMNALALMEFDREDRAQFAQLIGYSVSGFGDLSYVPKRLAQKADNIAHVIYQAHEQEQQVKVLHRKIRREDRTRKKKPKQKTKGH